MAEAREELAEELLPVGRLLLGQGSAITRNTGKMLERRTQQERKPRIAAIKTTSWLD